MFKYCCQSFCRKARQKLQKKSFRVTFEKCRDWKLAWPFQLLPSHFSIQEGGCPSFAFACESCSRSSVRLIFYQHSFLETLRDKMMDTNMRTLIANCFIVASSAVWFPEKYPATALWKRRSCFCITWKNMLTWSISDIGNLPSLCSHPRTSTWSERQSGASQTPPSCCWSWPRSRPASAGSPRQRALNLRTHFLSFIQTFVENSSPQFLGQ